MFEVKRPKKKIVINQTKFKYTLKYDKKCCKKRKVFNQEILTK